jgi:hypothetical protein
VSFGCSTFVRRNGACTVPGLGPEGYLRDVFRVLPHWPKDRNRELAGKYWPATRARLDSRQLATELGPLTIPGPISPPAEGRRRTERVS